MPKIKFFNHKNILLNKNDIHAKKGESILNIALKNNIFIEHACEKSCSCSTCHCIVIKGYNSLSKKKEEEDDILDKAWGLEPNSRLSCQAKLGSKNVKIKIPLYNNHQNNK
ncbi:ISC system 2Fe-2S type ferredoxin [Buchnera aphidicola]|uniref:ISC system 2Fe-2S type ferredoxin n=1 Tax=Buchnera aphidicola TaxID=9 RepID=UPI0030EB6C37